MFDMTDLIDALRDIMPVGEDEIVERVVWENKQIVVDFGDQYAPIFLTRLADKFVWEVYLELDGEHSGEIGFIGDAYTIARAFWSQVIASEYIPDLEKSLIAPL
jgi:hypothetical protein